MKYSAESFFAYMLVILFAGMGFLPLIGFAAASVPFITVLAVSPAAFFAAAKLYIIEEKRERARRRKAMRLRMACVPTTEPLRAA